MFQSVVICYTVSEIGELSQEIAVDTGLTYKTVGSDGVIGEAIDAII